MLPEIMRSSVIIEFYKILYITVGKTIRIRGLSWDKLGKKALQSSFTSSFSSLVQGAVSFACRDDGSLQISLKENEAFR